MRHKIRLTERDLHRIIKESVRKILKENDLTYKQIKNVTGIQDDDELNASVMAEDYEELEDAIWKSLVELANGENPRKHTYKFQDICSMLNSEFGLKYVGSDEQNEGHEFSNGKIDFEIFPDTFYPRQGNLRIMNMHVY